MSAIAIDCIQDIEAKVESLPALRGRVFHVYSEEELVERTKGLSFPCVGVIYDGLRSVGEPGKDSGKMGSSAELVVTVMIFFRQDTKAKNDPKESVVSQLDVIRKNILRTKSPSGHFWRFQIEAAVAGKEGVLTYLQRWVTPVQLS